MYSSGPFSEGVPPFPPTLKIQEEDSQVELRLGISCSFSDHSSLVPSGSEVDFYPKRKVNLLEPTLIPLLDPRRTPSRPFPYISFSDLAGPHG